MISSTPIKENLDTIQDLFNKPDVNGIVKQFYLKLAVLEVCGWVESCLDDLYKNIIVPEQYTQRMLDRIDKIYSFEYNTFQDFIESILGLSAFYDLENFLKTNTIEINGQPFPMKNRFDAILRGLKSIRNQCAHTYTEGNSQLKSFQDLYAELEQFCVIFCAIEKYLKRYNYLKIKA